DIEEGRRMARVHATVRSLIRAESAERAAVTLVAGVKAITGANRASLALYQQKSYALDFVLIAGVRGMGPLSRPSLSVSRFPPAWQEALYAPERSPDADLLRLDLPGEVNSLVTQEDARSFHAEPMTIAG